MFTVKRLTFNRRNFVEVNAVSFDSIAKGIARNSGAVSEQDFKALGVLINTDVRI